MNIIIDIIIYYIILTSNIILTPSTECERIADCNTLYPVPVLISLRFALDLISNSVHLRDEYDKRFSRIEELLTRSMTDLSNDTLAKINKLRDDTDTNLAHIEQTIDTINNDTKNHLDKKIDKTALSKLLSELQELSHSLDVARKD